MKIETIAFIGLGNMGLPMAINLANAGFSVNAYDTQPLDSQAMPDNLHLCASLSDCINNASVAITMLPNGAIVLDVLQQILQSDSPPAIIIDCSTIDINDARQAHKLAADAGVKFIDSPVSGGIKGAAAGTLTAMIGGDKATLDAVGPVMAPLFKQTILCGEGGAGQAAKICNNMLLATSMIGTSETFNLGKELGLDASTLFDILSSSTGSCWSVNSYCPLPDVGPQSPADNDYQPGFSGHMMLKDMKLTQSAAESVDVATPLGAHALALYQAYVDNGGGEEDFSGIIRYLQSVQR